MVKKEKKVILVDSKDNILGFQEKFAAHKNPAALHRSISILIFDKSGKLVLIQKRSNYKKTWPLFWTNTVCADVLPGETYPQTAKRRLKEEMGFSTKIKEAFSFIYKFKYDKVWGEHELDHVFIGKYEGDVKPSPKEAAGYEWIEIKELMRDLKKNPKKYTPWFKIILKKVV